MDLVDYNCRLLVYSFKCGASTNDGLVLEHSRLKKRICQGKLYIYFCIAGDDGYACYEQVISPFLECVALF